MLGACTQGVIITLLTMSATGLLASNRTYTCMYYAISSISFTLLGDTAMFLTLDGVCFKQ